MASSILAVSFHNAAARPWDITKSIAALLLVGRKCSFWISCCGARIRPMRRLRRASRTHAYVCPRTKDVLWVTFFFQNPEDDVECRERRAAPQRVTAGLRRAAEKRCFLFARVMREKGRAVGGRGPGSFIFRPPHQRKRKKLPFSFFLQKHFHIRHQHATLNVSHTSEHKHTHTHTRIIL